MKTFATTINNNESAAIRRETFDGQEHIVVPVVMIVDGVLNGALVTAEEYGRFPEAWNGRPVPVLHPEVDGSFISANNPVVIQSSTIGSIFNTRVDGDRLRAEAWINPAKARRIGQGGVVDAIANGYIMEVSVGYYSDEERTPGVFKGRPYEVIHRNIRPDHLALLPGEIGACSVADGCGTRVHKERSFTLDTAKAINTLAQALGLRANCTSPNTHGGEDMDEVMKEAEALKANGKMSAEQFEFLQKMDPEQRKMTRALMDAFDAGEAQAEEPDPVEEMEGDPDELPTMEEDDPEEMKNQKKQKDDGKSLDLGKVIATHVQEALARQRYTDQIKANGESVFSDEELAGMSVPVLKKMARAVQPRDYSGMGGFATNGQNSSEESPLRLNRGLLAREKTKEQ